MSINNKKMSIEYNIIERKRNYWENITAGSVVYGIGKSGLCHPLRVSFINRGENGSITIGLRFVGRDINDGEPMLMDFMPDEKYITCDDMTILADSESATDYLNNMLRGCISMCERIKMSMESLKN